jgi:hypothetical protein
MIPQSMLNAIKSRAVHFLMRRASPVAAAIAWSLMNNKTEWERDKYRIININKGISLWIANGPHWLEIEPNSIKDFSFTYICLSYFERLLLWLCAREYKWHDPTPQKLLARFLDETYRSCNRLR